MEELVQRRAALEKRMTKKLMNKAKLETEKARVEERLGAVDNSLQKKLGSRAEYDRVIQEAEQAYLKILESSQLLLNVVKTKSSDLQTGGQGGGAEHVRGGVRRGSQGQGVTPQTFPYITSS